MIPTLLTDDVVWDLPGLKHLQGKVAFDGEIENPDSIGSPSLAIDRLVEEGDPVVAIGTSEGVHRVQGPFQFTCGDVFTFRDELISRVEPWVVSLGGGLPTA
jgi:ketosteroid isomerase-like protein